MLNDFADSKVTIKKDELLSTIRTNLAAHSAELEVAKKGYQAALIKELEEKLALAKEGKVVIGPVDTVVPQDHRKDYERIVRMLEMSTATEVTITETQFSQYVLDEWSWMRAFKASTSSYLAGR